MNQRRNIICKTFVFLFAFVMSTASYSQVSNITSIDFPLSAGDAIRVQVFQNPDLTIETRLSENGAITYPLIGSLDIGGLSISNAEKKLAEALETGGFIKNPQVNIILMQIRGSQVSVLGQVNKPGRFPLESTTTRLSDMLAAAGGVTPIGHDMAVLTGLRDGKLYRVEIDMQFSLSSGNIKDDVLVQGGDRIFVDRAPVFYIYGEAQRPGAFRLERNMTVMQALAVGGGITARGTERRLRVHRKGTDGRIVETEPELTDPVLSNDVIYIKERLF
ncbi:MAG: polysaccharide export protein EpsE [Polaromonas sp.]|nr:polysaccharide export protein EpsE [Polaromonas sp.]